MAKLDWNEYIEKAVQVNAEGAVLVRNQGGLPLDKNSETAVFGRIQLDYYKSGTGSGGMVNVTKVTGITDGLIEAGAKLNEELLQTYRDWFAENPHDFGEGWGGEPWCQKEMPVSDELAAKAAQTAQAALVVIGRTAGEEQDNSNTAGSYKLTDDEFEMLKTVRKHFKRMIVVLNVGNIIDMSFVDEFEPEAVLYIWQGGMTGGTGAARVLLGEVSPSGKLPDTIAYDVTDYPSDKYFHNTERNFYTEDIYVGYRWFETFAKEKVRYPFGFGLSYTTFNYSNLKVSVGGNAVSGAVDINADKITVSVDVTNTGNMAGKEIVQLYISDKTKAAIRPVHELKGFEKIALNPGETGTVSFELDKRSFAWFNEAISDWYAASGEYVIEIGKSSRDIVLTETIEVKGDAPVLPVIDMDVQIGDLLKNDITKNVVLRVMKEEIQKFSGSDGLEVTDMDPMTYAMLQYLPIRTLRSFTHMTNERVESIVAALKEEVEKVSR